MLLSRIPQKETTEKFSVTFRSNTLADLQLYREFVQSKTGVDVGRGDLMEQIILDFFERDREFLRFKATRAQAAAAPAASKPVDPPPAANVPSAVEPTDGL